MKKNRLAEPRGLRNEGDFWSVIPLPEVRRYLDQRIEAGGTFAGVFDEAVDRFSSLSRPEKEVWIQHVFENWPFDPSNFENEEDEWRSRFYNIVMLHLHRRVH